LTLACIRNVESTDVTTKEQPAMTTQLDDLSGRIGDVERLIDERAIVDALYRFAAGQDLDDADLFLSASAGDARLDFTQPAALFEADVPPMYGRAAIAGIMDTLAPLRTTHTVTNPRVRIRGDEADLTALVEAQHVADDRRHLLLKNIYTVRLVRRPAMWVIADLAIRNVWWDGDPSILFPR
jgi:hypothetical protein